MDGSLGATNLMKILFREVKSIGAMQAMLRCHQMAKDLGKSQSWRSLRH
jgi:hypothetical protein